MSSTAQQSTYLRSDMVWRPEADPMKPMRYTSKRAALIATVTRSTGVTGPDPWLGNDPRGGDSPDCSDGLGFGFRAKRAKGSVKWQTLV